MYAYYQHTRLFVMYLHDMIKEIFGMIKEMLWAKGERGKRERMSQERGAKG